VRASEKATKVMSLECAPDDAPVYAARAEEGRAEIDVFVQPKDGGRGTITVHSSHEAYNIAQAATAVGDFLREREQDQMAIVKL
jgi:hypothetical protein